MQRLLPALSLLLFLPGCDGEPSIEPPPELGLVREAILGQGRHRGGPVKIRFAPTGPFNPRPSLLVGTPEGAALRLAVHLELPGIETIEKAAGGPSERQGEVNLSFPGEEEIHRLARAGLTVEMLPAAGILPRVRLRITGNTEKGQRMTLHLEGPVTTLDGRLVFQE